MAGEFVFAARTGAANSAVFIDDLKIGFQPSFQSGFNAVLPEGTAVYGSAFQDHVDGINNSGSLKLTESLFNQNGSFIIEDFNEGRPVESFRARFKVRLGDTTCCSAQVAPLAPPFLSVTDIDAARILITWQVDSHPWTLEQTTQLDGQNTIWTPVLQRARVVEGRVIVVVPKTSDHAFLRLRR